MLLRPEEFDRQHNSLIRTHFSHNMHHSPIDLVSSQIGYQNSIQTQSFGACWLGQQPFVQVNRIFLRQLMLLRPEEFDRQHNSSMRTHFSHNMHHSPIDLVSSQIGYQNSIQMQSSGACWLGQLPFVQVDRMFLRQRMLLRPEEFDRQHNSWMRTHFLHNMHHSPTVLVSSQIGHRNSSQTQNSEAWWLGQLSFG